MIGRLPTKDPFKLSHLKILPQNMKPLVADSMENSSG